MAVLMIGSTGNGKSALGNFLLNPDKEHLYEKQHFMRSKDNVTTTQVTSMVTEIVSSPSLKGSKQLIVIDTPGLNVSREKDLEHMIGLVEKLEEVGEISACFIVVKFDGQIDTQFKDTIKYYFSLLPVLKKNLVIVMTRFDRSKIAQRRRELAGVDVHRIRDNTLQEVVNLCGLSFQPMLFMIDSLPDEDDRDENLEVRDAILSHVFSLETTIKMTELHVQKHELHSSLTACLQH